MLQYMVEQTVELVSDKSAHLGMDLSSAKVTPEQKVSLCTKYFYLGFLCLPFLWGVNAAWFFGEAFRFAVSEDENWS